MTTIAVRDKILACDSRVSAGSTICAETDKAIITPWKAVAAWTGELHFAPAFFEWVLTKGGTEFHDWRADMGEGALVEPDGKTYLCVCNRRVLLKGKFFAFGSGTEFALGAMAMGATAEQAVKVASKFDAGTGGKIHSYTVGK